MLSTTQGLKDLTGNVHIDTLECRNLSATNFDIQNLQVATSLVPTQDNTVDLGSSAKRFKRAYVNDVDLGVTRANKQLKTDASGVVAFDPLLSVGTSNGLTLNSGTQVLDLALASASGAGAISSSTYNDVVANTAARHSAVTLGTANGLSLNGQQLSLTTASASTTGSLTSSDWSSFNAKAPGSGYQASKVMITSASGVPNTTDTTSDQIYALSYVTPGRALVTHPTLAEVRSSTTTATEIGYLSGVTSSVQNQISNKQDILFNTTSTGGENFLTPVTAVPAYTLNLPSHASVLGKLGIGIGGSASGAKLHVRDTTSGVRAMLDVNGAPYTGISVGLWFGNAANNYPFAQIDGVDGQPVNGSVFLGDLSFRTNTNQTMNEQMRIKASGNIGMGTSAPQNVLHVVSDTGGITVGSASNVNKQLALGVDPVNNRAYIECVEQGVSGRPLLLNPGVQGRVGIRVPDPAALVQINPTAHSTSAVPGLSVNATAANWTAIDAGSHLAEDRVVIGTLSGKATIGGHNNAHTAWSDLVINPYGGSVGIGTTTPGYRLHVKSGDVNVEAGYYRRDGQYIQYTVGGTFTSWGVNFAAIPQLYNWVQVGYVDLPFAGTWRLISTVRFFNQTNEIQFEECWSEYSAAYQAAPTNAQSYYNGTGAFTVGDRAFFTQCSGFRGCGGPLRMYLNIRVRHVAGSNIILELDSGSEMFAFRTN